MSVELKKNVQHLTLMKLQKIMEWLSKNFDIYGAVFFYERGHTYGMPIEQKCAATR